MIDKEEFKDIRADLARFEKKREEVIQGSREIITLSKQIIYALQRGDNAKAAAMLKVITARVKSLPKENYDAGIQSVAVQEYVEAAAFYSYEAKGKLPSRKELGASTEDYLMGLCDMTGELVRKAVNAVIRGNKEDALRIRELVDEIYGEFLQLELRNGELRKKSDSIKWNLNKLEEIALGIKMKG